jgi:hypothetical protein
MDFILSDPVSEEYGCPTFCVQVIFLVEFSLKYSGVINIPVIQEQLVDATINKAT